MYATFRYYAGNRELGDRLVENRSEVERIISGIDGFRAYYLIRTTNGDTISLSVFDNEASAEESTKAAAGWIRENLPDMSINPQVSSGEVVIDFSRS